MTIQVTILGLGQMGSSVGLALAAHREKIQRTGHDKDTEAMHAAHKAGVVDDMQFNLSASVKDADLVVLSLPMSEVRETLEFIRDDLKEGAVVVDISPARRQTEAWALELIPAGRYYLGLVPAINPLWLLETGGGLDGAHDDLFQSAICLVCPPPGSPESAVRLATDFVTLLGATPILSDSTEADGLLTTMTILPKLLAISLVDTTMGKPGWSDAQNLADRSFAMPVAAAFDRDEADSLCESALANRDNLVRVLDDYIASLSEFRDTIHNEDRDGLGSKVRLSQEKAYDWLVDRNLEKYSLADAIEKRRGDDLSFGARLKQTFLGGLANPNPDRDKR